MRARRMAVITVALALAGVPAAAAESTAVTAQTGLSGYLAVEGPIQRSGFWGSAAGISDEQVLAIGYTQCDLRKRGLSDLQVLTQMAGYQPTPGTPAYDVGLASVRNAVRFICP